MQRVPIEERNNCLAEARIFTNGGYGFVAMPYVTEAQRQYLLQWQDRVLTELGKQQHRRPQTV